MTDIDHAILKIEAQYWKWAAVKHEHIRITLSLTSVAYYARLAALLADPAAEAEAPALVRRLRRLREARAAVRSAARLGV